MILPQSGSAAKWLEFYANAATVISAHANILTDGVVVADFGLESGTVTLDRTAAVRRTCSLVFSPSMSIATAKSLFAPYGNEVRPWWQVRFPDGTTDEVCMGTFTIEETKLADSGLDLTIAVTGSDRSALMQANKLTQPYTVAAGETIDYALAKMISDHWSGAPLSFIITPTIELVPATNAIVRPGKTVWSQALILARSIGYELFVDVWGNVVGQPIPNAAAQSPVMQLTTLAQSGLKTATLTMTRKGIFSAFGIIGQGSEAVADKSGKVRMKKTPVYATVYDTDPASPTYYRGPFGTVGTTTRSTVVTNAAQATDVGMAELAAQRGASEALDLSILPFPLLDAWDVVGVTAGRLGISGNYVVDGWSASMHYSGSQSLAIRPVSS